MIPRLTRLIQKLIKNRLKLDEYIPTLTGFMTVNGPARGTIWITAKYPESMPIEVAAVDRNSITWTDNSKTLIEGFVNAVRAGDFVLIGTRPPAISHTAY